MAKPSSTGAPWLKPLPDMIKMGWGSVTEAAEWPEWINTSLHTVANERVVDSISVTYINHATTLVQVSGINILTDPI